MIYGSLALDIVVTMILCFLRVIQQSGTQALVSSVTLQYVEIDATLASAPESRIGGELVKCNRSIAQFKIHFHNCGSRSERKYLGIGEHLSREPEDSSLDACS